MDYQHPKTVFHHAAKWLGIALQSIAALWLLGWLQGNDPDCFLSTGIFMQLRMCEMETTAETLVPSAVHLVAIVCIFVCGYLCMRWATKAAMPPDPAQVLDL